MAHLYDYIALRIVAMAMALGLTGYSAWLSWAHFGEPTGPIAAVTGAGLFVFGEYAWRDRQWFRSVLLFGLGAIALVISGTAVLHRVAATQAAQLQAARSANLPRLEAQKALSEAREALAAASAAAAAECRSGRGSRCQGLEQREDGARQRVADARSKLTGLGAEVEVDPGARRIAAILPVSVEAYQAASPAFLPLWLELTAPLLLSVGLSPSRRKVPKVKQRRKRGPRKRVLVPPQAVSQKVVPLKRRA
jgi:hypothetical protein